MDEQKTKAEEFLRDQLEQERTKNARITADYEALKSEFATADSEDKIVEITRKHLGEKVADALTMLDHLLNNGTDGIRLNVAKYIIDRRLTLEKLGGVDAEAAKLNELIEKLSS